MNLVTDYQELAKTMELPPEALDLITGSGIRSVMHCPLVSGDTVFGALTLATNGTRTFTEADAVFGEELGRRVGTVLANLQLHERLANRLRGQEAVARLGQAAVVHHELEPLFEAAARELGEVLDGDITAIMQHLPARHALRIVAGSGWRDGVVGHAMIPDNAGSHSGFALISDGPVVSTDYATESRFRASPIVLEHGARSGVTTPIVGPDGPWGVLGVHSLTPGRFTPDQIALLDTFANVLGSAISRRGVEIAVRDRDDRPSSRLRPRRPASGSGTSSPGGSSGPTRSAGCTACRPAPSPELDAYLALVHEDDRGWVGERIHRAAETGAYDARVPDRPPRWNDSLDARHREGVLRPPAQGDPHDRRRARRHRGGGARGRAAAHGRGRTPPDRAEPGVHRGRLARAADADHLDLRRLEAAAAHGRGAVREAERADGRHRGGGRAPLPTDRGPPRPDARRARDLDIGLEPVAMPRVLERVIASEQERWPLTTIELGVQPGIPIALGDNTYIEQLIRNLVGNAAKYAPQGGTVQVAATATQPTAVAVGDRDPGPRQRPGLAEEDIEHLFDLFYRSPLTEKKARAPASGCSSRTTSPGDGRPAVGQEPPEAGPSSASARGRTSPRNEWQRLSPASGAPDRLRGRGRPLGNVVASGRKPS